MPAVQLDHWASWSSTTLLPLEKGSQVQYLDLPHKAAESIHTYHVQVTDLKMGGRPDGSPSWVLSAGQDRGRRSVVREGWVVVRQMSSSTSVTVPSLPSDSSSSAVRT